MNENEYDPFAGSTGLKEGAAVVVDSFFSTDANYNQGKTLCLHLKKSFDDGEEVTDRYPCGPDWASYDEGETAEHPKDTADKPMQFNVNSAVMELVNAAFASGTEVARGVPNATNPQGKIITDVEQTMRQISKDKFNNAGPRAAGIWLGLKFEWTIKTETKKFRDRDTNEMIERTTSRSLPSQYLGIAEVTITPGNELQDASVTVGAVSPPNPTQSNVAPPAPPTVPPPPPVPAPPPIPQPEAVVQPQPAQPAQEQPASPAPPAPPAPPAEPAAAPSQGLYGVSAETSAQIKVLAQSQPYHEWVDSVMAIPGVAAVPELVTQLADDALYNSLRAG